MLDMHLFKLFFRLRHWHFHQSLHFIFNELNGGHVTRHLHNPRHNQINSRFTALRHRHFNFMNDLGGHAHSLRLEARLLNSALNSDFSGHVDEVFMGNFNNVFDLEGNLTFDNVFDGTLNNSFDFVVTSGFDYLFDGTLNNVLDLVGNFPLTDLFNWHFDDFFDGVGYIHDSFNRLDLFVDFLNFDQSLNWLLNVDGYFSNWYAAVDVGGGSLAGRVAASLATVVSARVVVFLVEVAMVLRHIFRSILVFNYITVT